MDKLKLTPIYVIFVVTFVILLGGVASATPPIGCTPHNSSVIKCWNQGQIENTTYYHIDGVQLANSIERFEWATYDVGFAYYQGSTLQKVSFYDFPFYFKGISTDGLTYYRLEWRANFSAGAKRANITFSYSQSLYDNYVNMTYGLTVGSSGWENWNRQVWFWRKMRAINIDLDDDIDAISFYNDSGFQGHYLNLDDDLWHYNTSKSLTIGDMQSSNGIHWVWNNPKRDIFLKNAGADNNARVWWFTKSPKNITANFSKSMTERWIDAPACEKACPFGVSYGSTFLQCNATQSIYTCTPNADLETVLVYQVNFFAFFGAGHCDYTTGCVINTTDNSSGAPWQEIPYKTSTTEKELVCNDYSQASCKQNTIQQTAPSSSHSKNFTVRCREQGNLTLQSYFTHELDWTNTLYIVCPNDQRPPKVVLLSPANNSLVSVGAITFRANGTDVGNYPLTQITLFANFTGIWLEHGNQSGFPEPTYAANFTIEVNNTGSFGWYAEYCDNNNNCDVPNNGNYTIITTPPTTQASRPNKQFRYYFLDRSSIFT